MNTRLILLTTLFVAAPLTWGCTGYLEPPKPAETPKAGDLPQAPPPRAKKTTAELLVGKWKEVESDGKAIPQGRTYTLEFTANGKAQVVIDERPDQFRVKDGTYRLSGNTMKMEYPADAVDSARQLDVTINSITEETLSITSRIPGTKRQSTKVFKRVKPR